MQSGSWFGVPVATTRTLPCPRGREEGPADGPGTGRRARGAPRDDQDARCAKERRRRGGLARPRPKTLRLQQVCGQVSPRPLAPRSPDAAQSSIAIRDAGGRLDKGEEVSVSVFTTPLQYKMLLKNISMPLTLKLTPNMTRDI